MKARWSIVSALGGAAVVWVSLSGGVAQPATQPASSPPAPSRSSAAPHAAVVTLHTRPDGPSIDVLRAAIRDELAAAQARPGTTADTPAAPTSAQLAAEEKATALLDDALAAGRWTPADEERLRALGAELSAEAYEQVTLAWAQAVNDQKLSFP